MDWKNDLKALLTQGKNEDARQLCLTHRPLFLYRYRSSIGKLDYRKDELLGNVYFSEWKDLNDPFEGMFMSEKSTPSSNAINSAFNLANSCALRLASFSEKKNIMPMWAHYADNHTGICFEYLTEQLARNVGMDLWPVFYVDRLVDRSDASKINNMHNDPRKFVALMKLNDWSYECEWRLRYLVDGGQWNKRHRYVRDDNRIRNIGKPVAVYFGIKTPEEVVKELADFSLENGIKTYRMEATTQGLVEREITS